MCTTSLFFLIFFCSSPSFFLSFFFYISSFFFMPFFLSSFLFFFLSFFLALLVFFFLSFLSWYTERAPTRTRVCWDSTHTGELLKRLTGELLKRLLEVPLLKRYFLCVLSVVIRAAAPVGVVGCLFGSRFCVSLLFVFVSVTPRPPPPFPSFVFLVSGVAPALPFFAFFCPLAPFFRLARLFYRLLHFSPLYRVIFLN